MLATIPTEARNMRELWIGMPDSLTIYLDEDIRTKMADIALIDKSMATENRFNGLSYIDSISDAYLSVIMSEAHRLEMKTLVSPKGDSCIVMLSTYNGDMLYETEASVYDLNWNKIGTCLLSTDLFQADSISGTDDNHVASSVAAKFDGDDSLLLDIYTFPKGTNEQIAQRKIKIFDLTFK